MHLSFPLALSLALPSPVLAATATTAATSVGTSVETSSSLLVLAGRTVPAKVEVEIVGFNPESAESKSLRNQTVEAVVSEGVSESQNPKDPQVRVTITVLGEYKDEGFNISIDARGDGENLLEAPVEAVCELCTEGELASKIRKEFAAVHPALTKFLDDRAQREAEAAAAAAAAAKQTPVNTGGTPPVGDGQTDDRVDEPEGMGTLGKAGAALMAVGGVGMAIGLGLAVNPPRQPNEMIGYELVSTRPPGYALLGIGGAALVTGVALFIVDRNRRKKQTAVAPLLGPGVAGLSWSGRF